MCVCVGGSTGVRTKFLLVLLPEVHLHWGMESCSTSGCISFQPTAWLFLCSDPACPKIILPGIRNSCREREEDGKAPHVFCRDGCVLAIAAEGAGFRHHMHWLPSLIKHFIKWSPSDYWPWQNSNTTVICNHGWARGEKWGDRMHSRRTESSLYLWEP